MEHFFLGIDPGYTSGVALVKTNPKAKIGMELVQLEEWGRDRLYEALDNNFRDVPISVLVVEDFKADFQRLGAGRFHDMETPKIIGAFQYWAHQREIPLVELQQPSVKPAGYGLAGLTYVKGAKGVHMQDAVAHCAYFLRHKWPRIHGAVEAEIDKRCNSASGRSA